MLIIVLLAYVPLNITNAAEALDKIVAVVNDGVITASELEEQMQLLKKQLLSKGTELPSDQILRKQILQHLIDTDLQLQLAKQNDITVDSVDLQNALTKIASNNKLTLAQLRLALNKQDISWKAFRENIRKEIIISRLHQKAVGQEILVSSEQVADYLAKAKQEVIAQQTYHLQNILIPLPEAPTTEQLNTAKEKARRLLAKINSGEDFSRVAIMESSGGFALEGGDLGARHLAELPQIFARHVTKMNVGGIIGPLRTGNGLHLIKLLSIHNAVSHQVVKTHARHILLKSDSSNDTETLKQANNIYQQIKAGKDFVLMAKQYSHDPITATDGGDLGWVSDGDLAADLEKAIKSLALKAISKPIKTALGWHIVEVLERKKIDDSASFQRQQIRQFLHQRKFNEAVQNWQQHVRAQAYVNILDKQLA